jgi:predicted nucleotidyltransferase
LYGFPDHFGNFPDSSLPFGQSLAFFQTRMELSGHDIDVLRAFFGQERLKRVTITASFARGMLSVSRDVDMIIELNYPADLGPVLASMKFALRGILKLKVDAETVNGVARCLSVFLNNGRVLIFEE